MALSDCPQCWDTPCHCGHQYKHFLPHELIDLIHSLTAHVVAHPVKLKCMCCGTEDPARASKWKPIRRNGVLTYYLCPDCPPK